MQELPRILQLPSLLQKKSFFLFGPRATGKSYLTRQQLDLDRAPVPADVEGDPQL